MPTDLPLGVYIEKRDTWTAVPLISWEQAISWPNCQNEISKPNVISTDIELSKSAYALEVLEDGWLGFLKNTKLIIDPSIQPKNKSYAVVHKKDEREATFKQILIHDGAIYLKPLNPDFETTVFDANKYEFKGVLLQARMDA